MNINPQIDPSWLAVLAPAFSKPSFVDLKKFLVAEIKAGKTIYPTPDKIFAAFNACPFEAVKVVILGQDPYHGPGQAHGLSFSVNPGCRIPPSLKNIYKELHQDINFTIPEHGCLTPWANQGVLLLNATLTVEAKIPGSHQNHGWEAFTDQVIQTISDHKENVVFCLWGNFARSKKNLINAQKHLILEAPHPSPFSAHTGFLGCRHFSKTNEYLEFQQKTPINWQL